MLIRSWEAEKDCAFLRGTSKKSSILLDLLGQKVDQQMAEMPTRNFFEVGSALAVLKQGLSWTPDANFQGHWRLSSLGTSGLTSKTAHGDICYSYCFHRIWYIYIYIEGIIIYAVYIRVLHA